MSITKLGKKLGCLLVALLMVFAIVSCTTTVEDPAKVEAQAHNSEIYEKIYWDSSAMVDITASKLVLITTTKYEDTVVSWESSDPSVISPTGAVTRPSYDHENATLVNPSDPEDTSKHVEVKLTAVITTTYSEDKAIVNRKEFKFTVLCLDESLDFGTIAEVKAHAYQYIYEEQNVEKGLVSNSSVTYSVGFYAKVTAILNASGAGQFMVHDGTEGIYVYNNSVEGLKVGDTVLVYGNIYSYYGSLQVGSNITVSVVEDRGIEVPDYTTISVQEWEDSFEIGYLGGKLYSIYAKLETGSNGLTSDSYRLVDPYTGEVAWIYYKSYNAEQEEVLKQYVGKYVTITGVTYDRDSRIIKNHLLWDGGIEEAEAPVLSDEQKVNVIINAITLASSHTEDFTLPAAEGTSWEVVSGTGISIEEGVAKVTQTTEEQTVVLKVVVAIGEARQEKEFTVTIIAKIEEKGPWSVAETFAEGVSYKFGLAQTNLSKTLFITGEMNGYYFATTEDAKAAADVYVVAVEGGYNLKVVKADGTVSYMEIVLNGTYINVVFNETPTLVWAYNEEYNTFTAVVNEKTYYLGTYKTYNTVSASTIDKAATSFVGHLYEGNATVAESFEAEVAYIFGLAQTNLSKTLFITGEMNGYYFATTEDAKAAADVYVVAVEGGYNLKVVKADGTVSYMEIVLNGTYINVVFNETPTLVWAYNEEYNTFTAVVNEKTYYLGTYKTYNTVSASTIDKAATSFVGHLYDNPFGPNAGNSEPGPEPEPENCVTISFADKANRTVFTTEQQVWAQNGITVTNDKAKSTTNVGDYANPARFYAHSNIKIEYEGEFTKIVISTNSKNFSSLEIVGAKVTIDGSTCTIEFEAPVSSVVIEDLAAQVRFDEIKIYPAE